MKEEITMEIRKYFNRTVKIWHIKMWDAAKAALRGKFIALHEYIIKKRKD